MFYKFNSITSRIVPSSQNQAYVPQGLEPKIEEGSKFAFGSGTTRPGALTSATSTVVPHSTNPESARGLVPTNEGYQRLMQYQKYFANQDGRLVWQKLGARDKLPYQISLALCAFGLIYVTQGLFRMGFTKKEK